MNAHLRRLTLVFLLFLIQNALGGARYVDLNNPNPAPPYTTWATAATIIQDAIDAAADGDLVLVTNGVYQTGGKVVYGSLTNRVAVNKAVTVQSVNGPDVTIIKGYQVPGTTNGNSAVRCVYLDPGATLVGFTITNGATLGAEGDQTEKQGGGVFVFYTGTVSNCVIVGNAAYWVGGGQSGGTMFNCTVRGNTAGGGGGASGTVMYNCTVAGNFATGFGGGVSVSALSNCFITDNISGSDSGGTYSSELRNCLIAGNSARFNGGGAYGGTLDNCTILGNVAAIGGGVHSAAVRNSIVYYNTAPDGANCFASTLSYCCTTPLPVNSTNNIDAEPVLVSPSHLSASSPCRNKGNPAYSTGLDIDQQPWANPPSIGCDEYYSGTVTGLLSASIRTAFTNVATGFEVSVGAEIKGQVSASAWDFGDGTVISNRPYVSHTWTTAGNYPVVLRAYNETYPDGVMATAIVHVVQQPIHHVVADNPNPIAPYLSWATAANNIQEAVDAAFVPGALVLVTNGVYATGGRAVYGAMTNRVAVTKRVTVQSVNGPETTAIVGNQVLGTTNGEGAVRCVYLDYGATLSGFTLTNGATRSSGDPEHEQTGGGIWCYSTAVVVSNCVIAGNSAFAYGGGCAFGTLVNSTVAANFAQNGGGAYRTVLTNCTLTANWAGHQGGGAFWSTLSNCTLTANAAPNGGAAFISMLFSCTVASNSASFGGGTDFSRLYGCLVTGNSARYSGGGVQSGVISNSVITGNSAGESGAGAYQSYLYNCAVVENSAARYGGGIYQGSQVNCTITGNSAGVAGGGAYDTDWLYNSIIYYNNAKSGANFSGGTLNYCCTTPLPFNGSSNITADPQLAGPFHLSADSPCRNAGLADAVGMDIEGETWLAPPSIGCDEYYAGSITGALAVAIHAVKTTVAKGFAASFSAQVGGHASASVWDFGDGTIVSNRPYATHAWASTGDFAVVLRVFNESNPTGVTATQTVQVVEGVYYVAAQNPSPQWPFSSWTTAATNIQDAVDAATVPGSSVLVSNGVYATGGRTVGTNNLVNRVVVDRPLTLRSVNGPQFTFIQGFRVPGTTNGNAAVRCVYLATGASLVGFTLTNGATRTDGDLVFERAGGGLFCEDLSAIASNCVLAYNSAAGSGGGVDNGTLTDCLLVGNSASSGFGGGAYRSTLISCTLASNSASSGGGAQLSTINKSTLNGNRATFVGGGANMATLNSCSLMSNWAGNSGGGASQSTLNNCVLTGNTTVFVGGGANVGTLNNCILIGNSASQGGGSYASRLNNCTVVGNAASTGGGSSQGTQYNSILYYNSASVGSNFNSSTPSYCCTMPLPVGGAGNFTNAPLFVNLAGNNLRLSPNSPCINGGRNSYITNSTDLDDNPRIVNGAVDIGGYEFQGTGAQISYAWLQRYGWPTDGSEDFNDADDDGASNWHEWLADTIPTNSHSALRMVSATNSPTGMKVTWQSVSTRRYFIERATNLVGASLFYSIVTNIVGASGSQTITDTGVTEEGSYYYRVGVH